ncbi:glycosyltransferase family 2 protein [Arachnia propionica]|uniref:Glycosyltransferase family 2 protein n=1 Tax=Arachnia propionica TaxID=1750 RepID=A0A3P1T5J9_9ACTN|nr:glycosyltransferase family 2 protein [Arachnia propionica]RRD03703.1 glycosyltransferase family 2 protein [Arachnia propionica]
MSPLMTALAVVALPGLLLGLIHWVWYPFAVLFEFRQHSPGVLYRGVRVSVIIPAYNEGVVLHASVASVLDSGYPNLQVVVVNDGSTDNTWEVMQSFAQDPRVVLIDKPNGGKGSALNAGIEVADGEVFLFVDADGLFTRTTIPRLLAGFRHRGVGAVCGNDQPINVTGPLTRLLALMTHVGTGLTRRALALLGILPIVSGNSGAFLAHVVREVGGFRTDTLGEDLELTWRVQFAGYDVEFAPRALVLAEVPSTLKGLWKQRVRWQRGLIQTARFHAHRALRLPRSRFDWYLPLNLASMLVAPVLQLIAVVLLVAVIATGELQITSWWAVVLLLGLEVSLAAAVIALVLDRAWHNIPLLIVLPLWLPLGLFLSAATARAIWAEFRGTTSSWNKLERTGVRNRTAKEDPLDFEVGVEPPPRSEVLAAPTTLPLAP